MSNTADHTRLLRLALAGDALASGTTGLLLAGGSGILSDLLGLPEMPLLYTGVFLLVYAAIVAWTGTRKTIPRAAVWMIIAANALWVIDSFALLLSDWVSPTALGTAFIIAQALVVAIFAILQRLGLRDAARPVLVSA